jgi:hydrogenase maturation protease
MRVLVAGLGNIFEGDDGFGVAVAQRLSRTSWPAGVLVRDFGIRGVHLAYELLEGYGLVVIADAVSRGGAPGTLYIIEHHPDHTLPPAEATSALMDAHDLGPDGVLALVPRLGGELGRVVVLGCEPADLSPGIGLSDAVTSSVDGAVGLVIDIVQRALEDAPENGPGTSELREVG